MDSSTRELQKIGFAPARGFRDILPQETLIRDQVTEKIVATYRRYGFERIEAPAVEDIRRLRHSDGGENLSLLFEILKRGELSVPPDQALNRDELVDFALRYDLTVPLARYYAQNRNALPQPFKAIHIGPVWRAERPQKFRYRQFVQCDIDTIGVPAPFAEIELINVTAEAMSAVGFTNVTIRINDRRILKGILDCSGVPEALVSKSLIILDKLDKVGLSGVKDLLAEALNDSAVTTKLFHNLEAIAGASERERLNVVRSVVVPGVSGEVIDELGVVLRIAGLLAAKGTQLLFDPFLVRGMGYYTGIVFEMSLPQFPGGSVGGGGRYDQLIGKFSGVDAPACGFSIGFERIIGILLEDARQNGDLPKRVVLFYEPADAPEEVLAAVQLLQASGSPVSMLPKPKNLKAALTRLKAAGFVSFGVFSRDDSVPQLRAIE